LDKIMRKKIPSRDLSRRLFPPVDSRDHILLENALDHPFRLQAPENGQHSPLNAWWLAELSLLAYAGFATIESELTKVGLRLAQRLDSRGTQGFVAERERVVIVAFRGTEVFLPGRSLRELGEVLADAITDSGFSLVPAPASARGRVHSGFLGALDKIFDEVQAVVRQASGKAVWLTGHSLGGSLAILAAARLPRVEGVYVFGAPLVGDADFGKALPRRPFRFVHGSDLVTRILVSAALVPPRFPFLGFYRLDGETVTFDREGRLRRGGMTAGLRGFGSRTLDLVRQPPLADLIDHAPLFYAIHLWNLFDESRARGD
jgi:hypothetical protein